MGARRNNNPKVVSRGYTRDHPCMAISDLRRAGLLEGPPKLRVEVVFWPEGARLEGILHVFNDADGPGCAITLKHPYNPKGFKLVHIPTPFGGKRWFFQCPESGIRCSELYWADGYFAPRQVHRLTYASQGESRYRWRFDRRAKLFARLAAPPRKGPRGRNRQKIWDEIEALEADGNEELALFAAGLGVMQPKDTAKARRTFLDIAVTSFARDLKPEPPVFDEANLELLKELFPYPPQLTKTLRWARNGPEISERLDATVLDRHGLLAPGTLWARTIDWWRDDVGEFDLIIDARQDGPTAVMVQHRGEEGPSWQLFWIERFAAPFGRNEARFVCPDSGVKCRDLFFTPKGLTPDLGAAQVIGPARIANPKRNSGDLVDCLSGIS